MSDSFPKLIRLVEGNTIQLDNQSDVVDTETSDSNDSNDIRSFEMKLYTGARVETSVGSIIFDVNGVRLGAKKKPILLNHSTVREDIVGHSTSITKDKESGEILLTGVMSAGTDGQRMIESSSDKGFPWQASMGIRIDQMVELDAGEEIVVNGTTHSGPIQIVKKSSLKEASFVPLGADTDTRAVVLAQCASNDWVDLTTEHDEIIEMRKNTDKDSIKVEDGLIADSLKAISELSENFKEQESANMESEKTEVASGESTLPDTSDSSVDSENEEKSITAKIAEFNGLFPNSPRFVIDQIQLGHNVFEAKSDYISVLTKENESLLSHCKDLQLAVKANEEIAGSIVASDTTMINESEKVELKAPDPSDPKAVAEWEWESDPDGLQKSFKKRNYIALRNAELTGRFSIVGQSKLGKRS